MTPIGPAGTPSPDQEPPDGAWVLLALLAVPVLILATIVCLARWLP